MRRKPVIAGTAIIALFAWATIVGWAVLYGVGRRPLAPRGDADAFLAAAAARLEADNRGIGAIALIDNGQLVGTHFQSRGEHVVDQDSLFQLASLSKWITAWGVMTLVEQGRLKLDNPVSSYLTRWHLPETGFDNDQVTVRRLLSHTAGLTDGLGYAGFAPREAIDTLEQSLTRASDPLPGRDGLVRVGARPGAAWRYSGGGYTLLQLLVEEVSGETFNDYMRRVVLLPLGMDSATYVLDDATRAVTSFDKRGAPATNYTFTATGAASLYGSLNDVSRFLAAQSTGGGVLTPSTLAVMREPAGRAFGIPVWGLGVILYAPNAHGGYIIGHDGSNAPAINTTARIDQDSGDGIIILETGEPHLATRIGGEWTFWHTGRNDVLTLQLGLPGTIRWLVAGWLMIILAVVGAWTTTGRRVRN